MNEQRAAFRLDPEREGCSGSSRSTKCHCDRQLPITASSPVHSSELAVADERPAWTIAQLCRATPLESCDQQLYKVPFLRINKMQRVSYTVTDAWPQSVYSNSSQWTWTSRNIHSVNTSINQNSDVGTSVAVVGSMHTEALRNGVDDQGQGSGGVAATHPDYPMLDLLPQMPSYSTFVAHVQAGKKCQLSLSVPGWYKAARYAPSH